MQALLTGLLSDHPHIAPRVEVLPVDKDILNSMGLFVCSFCARSRIANFTVSCLSAYNVFPSIAKLKKEFEKENASFAHREDQMAERKHELMRLIPLFRTEPFLWMTAADYFTCRAAHAVPFIEGTQVYVRQILLCAFFSGAAYLTVCCLWHEHFAASIDHLSYRFHQVFLLDALFFFVVCNRLKHNASCPSFTRIERF